MTYASDDPAVEQVTAAMRDAFGDAAETQATGGGIDGTFVTAPKTPEPLRYLLLTPDETNDTGGFGVTVGAYDDTGQAWFMCVSDIPAAVAAVRAVRAHRPLVIATDGTATFAAPAEELAAALLTMWELAGGECVHGHGFDTDCAARDDGQPCAHNDVRPMLRAAQRIAALGETR